MGGNFVFDAPNPYLAAKYVSRSLPTDPVQLGTGEATLAGQLLAAAEVVDVLEHFVRKVGRR